MVQNKEVSQLPSVETEEPAITDDLSFFSDSQLTAKKNEEIKDSNIIYTMQVVLYDEKGKIKEQLTLKPSSKWQIDCTYLFIMKILR